MASSAVVHLSVVLRDPSAGRRAAAPCWPPALCEHQPRSYWSTWSPEHPLSGLAAVQVAGVLGAGLVHLRHRARGRCVTRQPPPKWSVSLSGPEAKWRWSRSRAWIPIPGRCRRSCRRRSRSSPRAPRCFPKQTSFSAWGKTSLPSPVSLCSRPSASVNSSCSSLRSRSSPSSPTALVRLAGVLLQFPSSESPRCRLSSPCAPGPQLP